jgi:hypothetical protein
MSPLLTILAIFAIAALAGIAFALRRSPEEPAPSATGKVRVSFDAERVICQAGDKKMEVEWEKLVGVAIRTTDEGPFVDDVFFLLVGDDSLVVVPSEADGAKELLARLQDLPGFDHQAVIAAMSCTENQTFPCWEREKKKDNSAPSNGHPNA